MSLGHSLFVMTIGCIASLSSLGCAVLSPPPFMPQLAPTESNAPGDVRALLVVGLGGGIFSGNGVGAELRIEGQVNEWATLGAGLGGGYNTSGTETSRTKHNHPDWIYAARTWGRVNPANIDWFSVSAGAGISGTNRGTVALTFNGSTLFGGSFDVGDGPPGQAFRLSPYGGPAAAVSIPLRQGDPIRSPRFLLGLGPDMHSSVTYDSVPFTTTYYVGAEIGIAADSGQLPAWTGALDLMLLGAFTGRDSATIFALSTAQGARVNVNDRAQPPKQ